MKARLRAYIVHSERTVAFRVWAHSEQDALKRHLEGESEEIAEDTTGLTATVDPEPPRRGRR